ncbi:hypothetical protein X769_05115 [Mesorhizobium sp. LSJC268A00]|nr:hypothetical protein X771_27595 [Mesorhizobium sp. LSJC277A00]ESX07170.1 hypothetical protein X769_05115 [Mesorhizobium sp. LSJC268A00]ESX90166.1 hypothetical protein X756_06280 [Mesorhizobium sp. LSHC412B00]ESY20260.1 hypothetical protein X751_14950 [Mesorhizobium sp. LNJC395A00]ESY28091.1 hypothetical protein X749_20285 [Mesorhizobium sp. LNJC391B00]ESZ17650.1 hypothetical protein X735_06150 [Mesorhizobium sp. L2C085B000]ESZ45312.1 hypothetical protein X731_18490 [Mesorhizobium sp. L2C05
MDSDCFRSLAATQAVSELRLAGADGSHALVLGAAAHQRPALRWRHREIEPEVLKAWPQGRPSYHSAKEPSL